MATTRSVSAGGEPTAAAGSRAPDVSDPLRGVVQLGKNSWVVLTAMLLVASTAHGGASARAFIIPWEMVEVIGAMRRELNTYFWLNQDVDVVEEEKDEDEKEDEPDPEEVEPLPAEPVVEDTALPPPPPPADTPPPPDDYDDPPPAPGKAADVLTAPEQPGDDDYEDFTDFTIPDKDGSRSDGHGYVATKGTDTKVVTSPNAQVGGKPGGTGTGPPPPPPPRAAPAENRSRPAMPASLGWNCAWPPEADTHQVNRASAVIAVTVGPSGNAQSVSIVADPGYGFGAAARRCALARTYAPALDAWGKPITGTTPAFRVRFTR